LTRSKSNEVSYELSRSKVGYDKCSNDRFLLYRYLLTGVDGAVCVWFDFDRVNPPPPPLLGSIPKLDLITYHHVGTGSEERKGLVSGTPVGSSVRKTLRSNSQRDSFPRTVRQGVVTRVTERRPRTSTRRSKKPSSRLLTRWNGKSEGLRRRLQDVRSSESSRCLLLSPSDLPFHLVSRRELGFLPGDSRGPNQPERYGIASHPRDAQGPRQEEAKSQDIVILPFARHSPRRPQLRI
jgi:hypothetical protein